VSYLWLFSVVAWHLYRRDELARWVIGLASMGLCLQVLKETDWQNLAVFFSQRQDFGFSWTGAGLLSALAIWGFPLLTAFAYRKYQAWVKWGVAAFALIGIVVLSEALILTQSRAGWGALLVAVLLTGTIFIFKERMTLKMTKIRQLVIIGLVVSLLLGGLLATNFDRLSTRILSERDVYTTLLSFDRTKIPYTSVGIRAHMLLYGIELWQEKPLLGWGIGSSRSLLAMDDHLKVNDHPHFHNNYLELLVEQGVVGLLFYALAFIILMRGLFKAYAAGNVARDLFYYLIGAWSMVLIWSLADSRMVHVDVRFALLLLSGITFSVILARDEKAISNSG
jgi:O-antigen ligase